MTNPAHHSGLIVASNRLPVVFSRAEDGSYRIEPGSGGLVSALLPVLRDRGGTWVGWPGMPGDSKEIDPLLADVTQQAGYQLKSVPLSEYEQQKFYQGFCNEVIWPLFHDMQLLCNFDPSYWRVYQTVNRRYAEVLKQNSVDGDFIWVHDYHLMNVAQELRKLGAKVKTAFFLHIPFPPLDIFVKLPWRFQLLRALVEFDLIGFQTLRDQRNFVQCVRTLLNDVAVRGRGHLLSFRDNEREVRVSSFPIGIDFNAYAKRATSREVTERAKELRNTLPNRQLILGVDRLDYTKGIPERLEAFRNALQRYPDLHNRVTLIQVVVPSREVIPQYFELKTRIERLVGEINGQFTRPGGWVPIHYVFRNLNTVDLLAYYRAAEVALVTPHKDGMNLVAKEYCACSIEEECVLILSEFAGAAAQLQRGALLVNPFDIEGVADAIHRAFVMGNNERRAGMRHLRRAIREQDIFWWVDSFLRAAISKNLSSFPLPADYVPHSDFDSLSL